MNEAFFNQNLERGKCADIQYFFPSTSWVKSFVSKSFSHLFCHFFIGEMKGFQTNLCKGVRRS